MPSVCFTGKGMSGGAQVTRNEWIEQALAAGFRAVAQVDRNTDYLVASRHDTQKAISAHAHGTTVFTYDQWQDFLAYEVVAHSTAPSPPKPRKPADLEGMDQLEEWGMF